MASDSDRDSNSVMESDDDWISKEDQDFYYAVKRGDTAAVVAALRRGANINTFCDDRDGLTALHQAAYEFGSIKMMKVLLNHGANINARDKWGKTPMHRATDIKAVQVLLRYGADVDAAGWDGPLLHYAAEVDSTKYVEMLLRAGANVLATNNAGNTPLEIAKRNPEDLKKTLKLLKVAETPDAIRDALHRSAERHAEAARAAYLRKEADEGCQKVGKKGMSVKKEMSKKLLKKVAARREAARCALRAVKRRQRVAAQACPPPSPATLGPAAIMRMEISGAIPQAPEVDERDAGCSERINALKEKVQNLTKRLQCKICDEEEISILLQPCSHHVCCERCSTSIKRCPICRAPIEILLKTITV